MYVLSKFLYACKERCGTHTHTHTRTHTHIHTDRHTDTHMHTQTHTHKHTHTQTHTHTQHTHDHTNTCYSTCTISNTRIQILTHTCTHPTFFPQQATTATCIGPALSIAFVRRLQPFGSVHRWVLMLFAYNIVPVPVYVWCTRVSVFFFM